MLVLLAAAGTRPRPAPKEELQAVDLGMGKKKKMLQTCASSRRPRKPRRY